MEIPFAGEFHLSFSPGDDRTGAAARRGIYRFFLMLCGALLLIATGAEAGAVPSGLPQKAASLLARARRWHNDAELMIVDVNDWSNNGQYAIQYDFFSPSTGEGFMVTGSNEMPVAAANWGTVPIPPQFLDLPAAIKEARAQGMGNNAWDHAHLQAGPHGVTWIIKMTQQVAAANDPFSRSNAFEIPATGGSMFNPAASSGYAGAGTAVQYDPRTGMPCPTGGCVTGGFVGKYARSGGAGPFAVPPPLHDPNTGGLIPGTGAITQPAPGSPANTFQQYLNGFGLGGSAPAQNSYGGAPSAAYGNGYGGAPAENYRPMPPASVPQSDQEQIERQRREIERLQNEE